ncbi:MAG: flavin reductase family protein [SAR324 cluster bacterium]|nr:flavin reductase family protein [SAR324 cluster bacterium]MCZ6730481.1 flavin reductase family protein [SAR324 cluster bacterium]MCZ6841992.1 flavin reductase family protein [SAR324 cluster bacterium]
MDIEAFKAALGRFGTGVAVITTRDGEGAPAGFTASSFTSLSLSPPMVLFCLDKAAVSFEVFRAASGFVVNILNHQQQDISNRFASHGEDKFNGVKVRDGAEGLPLIEGCLANLECRTTDKVAGGDHLIFIGEVRQVHLGEGTPLLYYMGKYHGI